MKTGGHIKPCKVGQVEEHNERRPEYVERMKTSKHPLNFYPTLALRPNDNSYNTEREEYKDVKTKRPLKVAEIFKKMIEVYQEKDKRHRMPPLKERERFDPKSGKMKTIAGWSPIREMVVVIKPDTKRQDFAKVATWFRKNGVEPMFLSLHFDEGHLDEQGNLKANNHAHMGLDFFDWSTGKTVKLGPAKMKELQTVLADALGMERGEIKEVTGAEHLDVVEQRLESRKKELMPKLMKALGKSDQEALEAAKAIIESDRKKAQRFLTGAESKYRNAEKKLGFAEERLEAVKKRESAIDSIIDTAKAEERARMQPEVDEWKGKYEVQVSLNHRKNEQLATQRDTIKHQDQAIGDLKATIKEKDSYIALLVKMFIAPLKEIFTRVMNTMGHCFEGDDAGFVKTLIGADTRQQERDNARNLWDFVTKDLDIRTHTAWMDDTKRNLMELADEGHVQKQSREQGAKIGI